MSNYKITGSMMEEFAGYLDKEERAKGTIEKYVRDVLGHSSIETTRFYLITTFSEYMRWLDGLRLVC